MRTQIGKLWLVGLLGLIAVSTAPSALAGGNGYRHDGYQGHRGHRVERHYRHKRHHRKARHYRHHRYNRHYRHGYRHGYRYRHRSHSNRGAYLAGGVILGSIITHALTQPRNDYRDTSYTRSRVVRERYSDNSEPTRRLFRDRDGNCFERAVDSDGSELLIELPASQCAW